jgi:hypothetical protein
MPTLLDRPTNDAFQLLHTIAQGYEAAGVWPCWQWVKRELWLQERDAEEILLGLPTWRHGYRSIRPVSTGHLPDNDHPIALTVHGMANLIQPGVKLLCDGFLMAINVALVMQQGIRPSVTEAVELKVPAEDFVRTVNGQAGTDLNADELFAVLRAEPATWRGVGMNGGQWGWDLTDVRLSRYAGLQSTEDYLTRLEEIVGLPAAVAVPADLSPMALPDALDHLDLAWRLATTERLVHVPRAAMAAKLTQPAASVEEFESRCSTLADLLNSLNLPSQGGTLQNLKTRLGGLLGDDACRAQAAVDVLRWVVALRAGQQHRGADARAEQAKLALGLATYTGNWGAAWDRLRAVTVQALDTIREEISSLLDR